MQNVALNILTRLRPRVSIFQRSSTVSAHIQSQLKVLCSLYVFKFAPVVVFVFFFIFIFFLHFPGVEPLHVHSSDLHAPSVTHRARAGAHHDSLPPGSQQHSRLHPPPRPALHGWHRGHPGVHGGAHGRHQAPWRAHGPQPAGEAGAPYCRIFSIDRLSSKRRGFADTTAIIFACVVIIECFYCFSFS